MAGATSVTTGVVRLSFPSLFKARTNEDGENPKFGCAILIPKSDKATVKAIQAAIDAAAERDKGKWDGKIPKNLRSPLRDGDEERDLDENPEYEGMYFMNVKSNRRPGVVNRKMEPLDEEDVYAGMYVRVAIDAFGYNFNGNKGISFGLGHVLKWKDGEPLGAAPQSAEDAFGDLADLAEDDDDELL